LHVHGEVGTSLRIQEKPESATILVVEDDEPIRLALRELLEVEGYEVELACDGAEALERIARETPALVVTDLQMPVVDGAQLCTRLRGDPRTAQIPIVVLTAAHRLDSVRDRVDAILRKPFDIDVLLSTVAQFIRPTLPPKTNATPSVRLALRPKRPAFVLYVTGGSASSERATRTVRGVVAAHGGTLEIVDVHSDEWRARMDGIAMTPTLMRTVNGDREVFLGDLSEPMLVEEFIGSR
jgi:CheY-like chemotaxis protein